MERCERPTHWGLGRSISRRQVGAVGLALMELYDVMHTHSEAEQRLGAAVEPLRPYAVTGRFNHDKELRVGALSTEKQKPEHTQKQNTHTPTSISLWVHI